jgi:hypothetical protein
MDELDHAGGQARFAAFRIRFGTAARYVASNVPAVPAARAGVAEARDELANVTRVELVELLLAQLGDQMPANDAFVTLIGLRTPLDAHDVIQPVRQIPLDGPALGSDGNPLVRLF